MLSNLPLRGEPRADPLEMNLRKRDFSSASLTPGHLALIAAASRSSMSALQADRNERDSAVLEQPARCGRETFRMFAACRVVSMALTGKGVTVLPPVRYSPPQRQQAAQPCATASSDVRFDPCACGELCPEFSAICHGRRLCVEPRPLPGTREGSGLGAVRLPCASVRGGAP